MWRRYPSAEMQSVYYSTAPADWAELVKKVDSKQELKYKQDLLKGR